MTLNGIVSHQAIDLIQCRTCAHARWQEADGSRLRKNSRLDGTGGTVQEDIEEKVRLAIFSRAVSKQQPPSCYSTAASELTVGCARVYTGGERSKSRGLNPPTAGCQLLASNCLRAMGSLSPEMAAQAAERFSLDRELMDTTPAQHQHCRKVLNMRPDEVLTVHHLFRAKQNDMEAEQNYMQWFFWVIFVAHSAGLIFVSFDSKPTGHPTWLTISLAIVGVCLALVTAYKNC